MNMSLHRIESIDMLRGLVIVLMALDHTRDFFSGAMFSPTDLDRTDAPYFLTRWITHLCAPTFVFLAGAAAYLSAIRHHMDSKRLARYLLARGLWLIVLELTLVRFGWTFNWNYHYTFGQVIWALGWSMLVLAGLVLLPRRVAAAFALATIAGHNAFDEFHPKQEAWRWLWTVLHEYGRIEYLPGYSFTVAYPLIPWVGVMAAGYCLGPLFRQPGRRRQAAIMLLGAVCIALFLILRLNNLYGDPRPWAPQKNGLFTVFSVLNCKKYPPSLLYLLMTLGLMFLCLALFEWRKLQRLGRPLKLFGKTPLFFYIVHLMVIHGTALALVRLKGLPYDWLYVSSDRHTIPELPGPECGYDLATVYAIWLTLLLLLYPLCQAYLRFKQRYRGKPWLIYL